MWQTLCVCECVIFLLHKFHGNFYTTRERFCLHWLFWNLNVYFNCEGGFLELFLIAHAIEVALNGTRDYTATLPSTVFSYMLLPSKSFTTFSTTFMAYVRYHIQIRSERPVETICIIIIIYRTINEIILPHRKCVIASKVLHSNKFSR